MLPRFAAADLRSAIHDSGPVRPVLIWDQSGEREATAEDVRRLADACAAGGWEVEIGFGKGRYLLDCAEGDPEVRLLGIEVAAKYYRLVRDRARRQRVENLVLLCGEAAYILATMLPRGFADRVHVYFPDPWPKDRHARRRLLDADTVDLVLGLLSPGGELYFASDHPQYGAQVEELLRSHPALEVSSLDAWSEGPRTNYEAKFVADGLPIRRLMARMTGSGLRHPQAAPLDVARELDA